MEEIELNAIYRHYKNKQLYKTLYFATHTETNEELIVYEALYGEHKIWCRPRSMWREKINIDGILVNRFTKVENIDGQI